MDRLPLIEMEELSYAMDVDSFRNELYIAEINGNTFRQKENKVELAAPVKVNAFFIVVTTRGYSRFCLDYVPYEVGENQLVIILPPHTVQLMELSPDFMGKLVIVSPAFLEGYFTDKKRHSMINYMILRKNPCNQISVKELSFLSGMIDALQANIRRRSHLYQKELLQNGLVGIMLEVGNILIEKQEGIAKPTLSRKEELLNDFLQLLFTHCKEQHDVSFYADKLCISPQYLSLILKEQTSKSASKWIDDALMTEAKMLLKLPNVTVQQVANELNFSDQSTFGKFFKKHMKISPLIYRKS